MSKDRELFDGAFKAWVSDKTYSLAYWSTEDIARYWAAWALVYASKHEACSCRDDEQIRATITDESLQNIAEQIYP